MVVFTFYRVSALKGSQMQTKSHALATENAVLPSPLPITPGEAAGRVEPPIQEPPTGATSSAKRSFENVPAVFATQGIFWGLALAAIATYLLAEGSARRSSDPAVVILGLATIVSLTCAVWVWWKEFSIAAIRFSRADVSPWFCFFVGLGTLSASHLWLSATNPAAFAEMNPLNSVPVLIAISSLLRELLIKTSTGMPSSEWENKLEDNFPAPPTSESTLRAGDTVVADSKVKKGSVVVQERWLSPVAELRVRDEQDVLFAGSKIVVGEADVSALATTPNSVMSQLIRSVKKAGPQTAAPIDQSKWSNVACFACLCVAASVGIFWNERGVSAVSSTTLSATVLCSAVFLLIWQSVCDMALSVSQALWRTGVFVKSRAALDRLRKVRHLAVVRDGTPLGMPKVVGFDVLDDRYDREALAGVLLALSGRANDPWQQAICRYINSSGLPIALLRAADFREYDGRGISAVIQGVEFTLGTEGFVLDRGVQLQSGDTCPPEAEVDHVLYLAIQRYVVLRLSLKWDEKAELETVHRFRGDRFSLISVVPGSAFVSQKISDSINVLTGDRAPLEASLLSDAPDLVVDGTAFPDLSKERCLTVSRYSGTSFDLPPADVVLFTSDWAALGRARETADILSQWEMRQRGLVAGLTAATIAATMIGLGSPVVVISLGCLACVFSLQKQRQLSL